jgi:hypothetical protein
VVSRLTIVLCSSVVVPAGSGSRRGELPLLEHVVNPMVRVDPHGSRLPGNGTRSGRWGCDQLGMAVPGLISAYSKFG